MGAFGQIRKRDDRIVPFDPRKLVDAIFRARLALRTSGSTENQRGDTVPFSARCIDSDRALAREVGAKVAQRAHERFRERIPSSAEMASIVHSVLVASGQSELAQAFVGHGDARRKLRETVMVRDESVSSSNDGRRSIVAGPWNKRRVADALIDETGLDETAASVVAAAVESRVLTSRMQVLSTALICEIANNELFERGYSARLKGAVPDNSAKKMFEAVLETHGSGPSAVREAIADQVLTEVALTDIHSPEVTAAHGDGLLHLHALDDPLRLRAITWNLPQPLSSPAVLEFDELLRAGSPSESGPELWPEVPNAESGIASYLDLHDLCDRIGALRDFVHPTASSGELLLKSATQLLQDKTLAAMSRADAVRHVIRALVACRVQGVPVVLELDLREIGLEWLEALLEISSTADWSALPVRVVLEAGPRDDQNYRDKLALAAELYSQFYPLTLSLTPPGTGTRPYAIPTEVDDGLRASVGRVTLNLPQISYRSGNHIGGVERELQRALDLAVKALLERQRFLLGLGSRRGDPLWDVLGRPQDSRGSGLVKREVLRGEVGVLGLNECVKFLSGREMHQCSSAFDCGREILSSIASRLEEESRRLGLGLDLRETLDVSTLQQVESRDRELHTAAVAEVDRDRRSSQVRSRGVDGSSSGTVSVYSPGVRFQPEAGADPLRRLRHVWELGRCVTIDDLFFDSRVLRGVPGDLIVALLREKDKTVAGASKAGTISDSGDGGVEWNAGLESLN